jgi:mersacidin/lichenicidin family type 2 lantibiotic
MAPNRKENAMSHLDIIRAWKDEEYRLSLSDAERTQLPDNPAGLIELTDAQLGAVAGGHTPIDFSGLISLDEELGGGKCSTTC